MVTFGSPARHNPRQIADGNYRATHAINGAFPHRYSWLVLKQVYNHKIVFTCTAGEFFSLIIELMIKEKNSQNVKKWVDAVVYFGLINPFSRKAERI